MNQTASISRLSAAWRGGLFMLLAGIAFAAVNVMIQLATFTYGVSSTSAVFWQYFVALIFGLPWVVRTTLAALKTNHLVLHIVRVICATIGVQLWVAGLSNGVPIWQAIALIMTSTFFVTIGAALFLGEKVGAARWLATLAGFGGGMIILEPWSDAFTPFALLPVGAALFWAATSLFTKELTKTETPESITLYLLLLLTPINAVLAGTAGGFGVPDTNALMLIVAAGILTAFAQWFITKAYASADAAYVQPFDHLKLPLNVFAGWLVFGWLPGGNLWLGAALIVAASLYIAIREDKKA